MSKAEKKEEKSSTDLYTTADLFGLTKNVMWPLKLLYHWIKEKALPLLNQEFIDKFFMTIKESNFSVFSKLCEIEEGHTMIQNLLTPSTGENVDQQDNKQVEAKTNPFQKIFVWALVDELTRKTKSDAETPLDKLCRCLAGIKTVEKIINWLITHNDLEKYNQLHAALDQSPFMDIFYENVSPDFETCLKQEVRIINACASQNSSPVSTPPENSMTLVLVDTTTSIPAVKPSIECLSPISKPLTGFHQKDEKIKTPIIEPPSATTALPVNSTSRARFQFCQPENTLLTSSHETGDKILAGKKKRKSSSSRFVFSSGTDQSLEGKGKKQKNETLKIYCASKTRSGLLYGRYI